MHTVVSLYPRELRLDKPLIPALYIIPRAEEDSFSLLHVDNGERTIYMGEKQVIRVPVLSDEIANALVKDFFAASLEYFPGDQNELPAHPGLFVLEGAVTVSEIKSKHADKIQDAREAQDRWFLRLVKMADDDFAKTGMHRVVSDLQRMAATKLGFLDRPWMKSITMRTKKCKFCISPVPEEAIVCPICRQVLDQDRMTLVNLGAGQTVQAEVK